MYAAAADLTAGFEHVRAAPSHSGDLRLVVRRPDNGRRELLATASLDLGHGLVGDNWLARGNRHTPDGSADPAAQVTVMNIRVAQLVAGDDPERIALAGDQLYVDFDLSTDNLPPGSLLAIGSCVLEVSGTPHTGCKKYVERFGVDATRRHVVDDVMLGDDPSAGPAVDDPAVDHRAGTAEAAEAAAHGEHHGEQDDHRDNDQQDDHGSPFVLLGSC